MTRNNLDQETSPYLLQHRDNPVHWQPWGPAALELAAREDRPILLSIGYAACHWCHVMAHESFEDPAIAATMNALFVNIKVDREERPDIDAIYQSSLALLGQQGGWPLTMFLTPDGQPFWGGTYFPNTERYGRPGFEAVLRRIDQVYREDRDSIDQNRDALAVALERLSLAATPGALTTDALDRAAGQIYRDMDLIHGGTLGAPKFPRPFLFEFLLRAHRRTGESRYLDAVTLSLDNICQGGIYDHLGGGFARYSTDELWLAPHFEKMLYDNALLLDVLRLAWLKTGNPLYEARIRETAAWLIAEMTADGGGFAASYDADSEGAEGRFYVWSEAEIDDVLGSDAAQFKAIYDVSSAGNWEGTNILNRLKSLELCAEDDERRLAEMRSLLLQRRARRERPGWDDKVLADWNGLAIRALALAGRALAEPDWVTAAVAAFDFVVTRMSAGPGASRLHHSCRSGQASHTGVLDDYVHMIGAALGLLEVTGDPVYLDHASTWAEVLNGHFRDPETGSYFYTADDAETLITRTRTALDNATPAGNGVLVGWLARLFHLTGDSEYRDRADGIVTAFGGDVEHQHHGLISLMNGFEDLTGLIQIVVAGDPADPAVGKMLDAAHGAPMANRIISVVDRGAALPKNHPAHGKTGNGDPNQSPGPVAFVCVGPVCSLPVTSADALRDQLNNTASAAA